MTTTEIKNLVSRYNIVDGSTMGKPGSVMIGDRKIPANALAKVKAHKQEILAWFAAEREAAQKAAAERKAKIDAIPGLAEIRAAIADMAAWRVEFEKSFDDVGGLGVRMAPDYDIAEMKAMYPAAAAYLRAEDYSVKTDYHLSKIGRDALEMVINGDHKGAMAYMDTEIDKCAANHMWN